MGYLERGLLWGLDVCREFWKALVFELWALGARVTSVWVAFVLFITRNMDAYRRQRDRFDVKVEGETVLLEGPSDDDSDDEAMVGGTTAFEDLCDGTPRSLRVDADGGGEEQQAQQQPTL